MKVYIHIYNDGCDAWDREVMALIELPAIPRIGDIVHINYKTQEKLEEMATKTREYEPNLRGIIDFSDFIYCSRILYVENDPYVHIELDKVDGSR